MIYITLTDFYNNFYINQSVFRLYKEHPDMFKEPTAIVGSSGSFPFNYWNGGYNSNEGKFLLKVEYEDLERNTYMPIRLDYSNIFLTEEIVHIGLYLAFELGFFLFKLLGVLILLSFK